MATEGNEYVETIRAVTKKLGRRASVHEIAEYAGDVGASGWGQRITKLKRECLVASSQSRTNGGVWVIGDDPSPDSDAAPASPRQPRVKSITIDRGRTITGPVTAAAPDGELGAVLKFLANRRELYLARARQFDAAIAKLVRTVAE